ncbi:hypothetical protein ANN_18843 [Periplaneta americana]|uniref:Uncharacterized protein n=1 Tax=Periplaneta americana TaxID=6978 RepID=A0ABQ8SPV0_PERAM|nr:hypothetical protein ANN_18843 [Periplaneta americana]
MYTVVQQGEIESIPASSYAVHYGALRFQRRLNTSIVRRNGDLQNCSSSKRLSYHLFYPTHLFYQCVLLTLDCINIHSRGGRHHRKDLVLLNRRMRRASAVKEIINIPTDTPDAMLYAPRRLRGLGVFKAQWEAYLQHLNICQRLLHVDNPHVAATRNLPNEIEHCIKQLPITFDCSERISSQKLRKTLREDSFHQRSKLKSKASIRQNASYEVYEEVGCISSDGSTRRADIIIDRQKDKGVILDPTIRFEMHEQQPQECHRYIQRFGAVSGFVRKSKFKWTLSSGSVIKRTRMTGLKKRTLRISGQFNCHYGTKTPFVCV